MGDYYGRDRNEMLYMTTATDPAANAAVTTAIVNTYGGVVVTLTGAGNTQTLQNPTTAATIRKFTVINNDTSNNNLSVVANSVTFTLTPGEGQCFLWDGSAWGPTDLGITEIPVPVTQGGTGAATAQAAINTLTAVASATNEHVLTKDTATGNAIFKAAAGGDMLLGTAQTVTASKTFGDDLLILAGSTSGTIKLNAADEAGTTTVTFPATTGTVQLAGENVTVGAGKTLDVSAGTLTLADNQISGDKVEGGTVNAITINTLTSTTVNSTTFDTNVVAAGVTLSGTTLSADGTDAAINIAITPKGTGEVDITKVDIDGGAIDGTVIGANSASTGKFTSVTTDTINESTGGAGVTIDGVTLKDGGALDITGGTNTFNLTNGTASLDVAAGKAVDINDNFTVTAGQSVTIAAEDNAGTITLDNTTLEIENTNATQRAVKIAVGTDAAATLTVEGTAGVVNQDLTTDASPTFTAVNATTFDTNVAAAGVTLAGTTLSADGTDAAINIAITPKGTGEVDITKVDIDGGAIDGTVIGANSAAAITCTTLTTGGKLTAGANEIECSNVDITGGSITGITDLAVADGGTGASTLTDHGV
nr:hypothetical protein [Smithellaceae bacterium]